MGLGVTSRHGSLVLQLCCCRVFEMVLFVVMGDLVDVYGLACVIKAVGSSLSGNTQSPIHGKIVFENEYDHSYFIIMYSSVIESENCGRIYIWTTLRHSSVVVGF